ncbi:hypothetical protein [Nannocystis sp. SCPEA4]|uniref:hypothetical protein n=1 Tax=Nannocystis sp. SCPEA4 TaxID=2996787 RepID=UPI00226EFEC6|nr:hypothetical protein [Nannocystis sp. SCPEA4]MCY1056581.1 hypothetical protein [Nannocystis sp. SCPEA4]
MSRLLHGDDDHPEASQKHWLDACALRAGGRYDGTAYLAGYVVECALKTVILYDRAYDPATGTYDPAALTLWHEELRKPKKFGHSLAKLIAATIGQGADYFPPISNTASVVQQWKETFRYQAAGRVTADQADAFLAWAEMAYEQVVQMDLDGVL